MTRRKSGICALLLALAALGCDDGAALQEQRSYCRDQVLVIPKVGDKFADQSCDYTAAELQHFEGQWICRCPGRKLTCGGACMPGQGVPMWDGASCQCAQISGDRPRFLGP